MSKYLRCTFLSQPFRYEKDRGVFFFLYVNQDEAELTSFRSISIHFYLCLNNNKNNNGIASG